MFWYFLFFFTFHLTRLKQIYSNVPVGLIPVYLAKANGWQIKGLTWGGEVQMTPDFNHILSCIHQMFDRTRDAGTLQPLAALV